MPKEAYMLEKDPYERKGAFASFWNQKVTPFVINACGGVERIFELGAVAVRHSTWVMILISAISGASVGVALAAKQRTRAPARLT